MNMLTRDSSFRSLIDRTDLGLAWVDTNFRVVLHNSTMALFCAKSTADVMGEHCFEVYRGRKEVCPRCPGRQAMQTRETVLQTPEPDSFHGVQTCPSTYAFPGLDAGGTVTGFLLVQEHQGSSKGEGDNVADNQIAFNRLVDTVPCMIWLSNPKNEWCYLNRAWLQFTGCSLEQELAAGWMQNVHPDDLQQRLTTGTEAFKNREKFNTLLRLQRHDGSYRRLLESASPPIQCGWFLCRIYRCLC